MLILRTIRDTVLVSDSCAALGLFDGVHPGHRAVISSAVDSASLHGLAATVFTFSIAHDRPDKKPASGSLMGTRRRNALLKEMGVNHILCPPFEEFRHMSPEEFVRIVLRDTLRAKEVFCGENYHFGSKAAGDVDDLRRLGGDHGIGVTVVPMVYIDGAPVSSTRIRQCIRVGDVVSAEHLLGRPFSIDFEVIRGRGLGRKLDFPTINQPLPDWFIKPAFGVYASAATISGRRYISVTNVGVKPTVGSDRVLAETCILGYYGDLYGRRVHVELFEFVRPEKKFPDVDALRNQIRLDIATARELVHRKLRRR